MIILILRHVRGTTRIASSQRQEGEGLDANPNRVIAKDDRSYTFC